MSSLGDFWRDVNEAKKQRRQKNRMKYTGLLISIGAEPKADGVWMYKDWFLYPSKGFVMNRFKPSKRMRINRFIKNLKEQQNEIYGK